ncbi:hypothetical protein ACFV1U_16960 [Streptomyces microflavus]|uniref:hypothetical protein n=1 Tax=Streptomyces microflavus TaxID=1919 RepID=UPI0036BCC9AD
MGNWPVGTRFTRCPSNKHHVHPGLLCEQIGDREWDPITGYRTEEELAANPTEFTGLTGLAARES